MSLSAGDPNTAGVTKSEQTSTVEKPGLIGKFFDPLFEQRSQVSVLH